MHENRLRNQFDDQVGGQVQQNRANSGIILSDGLTDKGDINLIANKKERIIQNAPKLTKSQISNIGLDMETSELDNPELIVVDPKRRRMGLYHEIEITPTQEHGTDMETQENQVTESKNEFVAGVAVQARLSL